MTNGDISSAFFKKYWAHKTMDEADIALLLNEALDKARAEGKRDAVCQTCGFPTDMPRVDVFLKNNAIDILQAERNQCPECGHQQDGWTIKPVYEHMQAVHNNFMAKKQAQVNELKFKLKHMYGWNQQVVDNSIDRIFPDCKERTHPKKERD